MISKYHLLSCFLLSISNACKNSPATHNEVCSVAGGINKRKPSDKEFRIAISNLFRAGYIRIIEGRHDLSDRGVRKYELSDRGVIVMNEIVDDKKSTSKILSDLVNYFENSLGYKST